MGRTNGKSEGRPGRSVGKSEDRPRTTKMTLAFSEEFAWRLSVYSTMKRVGPAELIEHWVGPTLLRLRLSFESQAGTPVVPLQPPPDIAGEAAA